MEKEPSGSYRFGVPVRARAGYNLIEWLNRGRAQAGEFIALPRCCQLFISRGGLIRAGVAQDPKTPLLIGHVDVTAGVDEYILGLGHKVARQSGINSDLNAHTLAAAVIVEA